MPRKAMLELDGKTVLAHQVANAWGDKCVTDVVVSSDSEEMLSEGAKAGACSLRRPPGLSHERGIITTRDVHPTVQKQWIDEVGGQDHRFAVVIVQGMIFRKDLISETVSRLVESDFDTVRTVARSEGDHPFYACSIGKGNTANYTHGHKFLKPRQEFPPLYLNLVGVQAGWSDSCMHSVTNAGALEISRLDAVEIHDPFDWIVAKAVYWNWNRERLENLNRLEAALA